jgi:hypothetical protein
MLYCFQSACSLPNPPQSEASHRQSEKSGRRPPTTGSRLAGFLTPLPFSFINKILRRSRQLWGEFGI